MVIVQQESTRFFILHHSIGYNIKRCGPLYLKISAMLYSGAIFLALSYIPFLLKTSLDTLHAQLSFSTFMVTISIIMIDMTTTVIALTNHTLISLMPLTGTTRKLSFFKRTRENGPHRYRSTNDQRSLERHGKVLNYTGV